MSVLNAKRLIAAIESGRRYGPMGIEDAVLDRLIEKARAEQRIFSTESSTATRLQSLISDPLSALRTERRALFERYDLFVLPENVCFCVAEPAGDTYAPSVILTTGMINLIGSTHFAAHVDMLIPETLASFYASRYRHFPFPNLFTTVLFLFRFRHFRYAEPMPDFAAVVPKEKFEELRLMIAGAVTALLLHEFAHHELKHLETKRARSMAYEMVVSQSLSDYQRQEAEADRFVLESVIEEASPLTTYWLEQTLDFFIQLELTTGLRDGYHPLAINRALNAGLLRQDVLNKFGLLPEDRLAHGKRLARKFQATEHAAERGRNLLTQTGRETFFDILGEAAAVLAPLGVDLAPLLDRNARLDCFELLS